MSTTIDQRVVEMQFDNRQFESNVHTSMSTLDKLKKSLNLDGASKGLDNINASTKRIDMSALGNAAETVGLKFNAMYTVADQALRNITNKVMHTAETMVSAFTIEPINTGLQEYETQINSVQTIMANTSHQGTTLNDVNSALDTLNTYADKTIYNFTEMTRNIGTFTAAGVDLQTSVDSIQGIANLAAVSGSTSQQASTAMYQLSQALAAGKVSLMDWNSVVNAGMGGKVFQDALVRTSELLDTGAKKAIEAHGSFRESLTKGEWLTTEVLTETLKQMAGAYSEADLVAQGFTQSQAKEIAAMAKTASDAATKVKTFTQLMDTLKESVQSGWTQTWELLIGDFEEAKELWTSVSDTLGGFINDMSESRNTLLAETLNSPWEKLIEQINKAGVETSAFEEKVRAVAKDNGVDMDALVKKYGSFEDACRSGKVSSDILDEALKGLGKTTADLSKITGELKLGDVGDDVKEAQKALQAMGHDIGKAGIDGIMGSATENAIKEFQKAKGIEITGIIDEKTLEALKEANTSVTDLSESCGGLVGKITELGGREMLIQSFANIFKALSNILRQVKYAFREVFPKASAENLISLIERFKNFTEAMKPSISTMWKVRDTFKGVFSVISIGVEIFKAVGSGFMTLLGKVLGFRGGLLSVTASIGNWLTSLNESIKKTDIFGKAVDKIVGFISNSIDKIAEFGKTVKESLKAPKSESFTNLFTSIWNIVRNLGSSIIEAVGSISTTIANAFGKGDIFEVFNSLFVSGSFLSIKKFVDSLNEELDIDGGIFENISGILEEARGCFQAYQETLKAEALKKIATAIALLAASLFVISTIDPNQLSKALGAITVLFVELLAGMAIFNKMGGTFKGALKAIPLMIAMSTAILILSAAMKNLANISWEGIAKGLIGIGVLMAELFVFMKYAKINVGMTASAVSIVILASALVILGDAVEKFANISWSGLVKGLAAIGVFLAEFTIFSKYVSKDMGIMAAGAALVLLATSMKILAAAMGEFAVISWEGIAKGLVGMAAAMTAMTVALNFIPRDSALRAAGLIVAAYAIEILYDILSQLGELSWAEMAKSLSTLGVALQLIGFGLKAMKGSIDGSAALLIASAALRVFAPVMQTLGSLEWGQIAKGLVAIAGAFAVFGLAGLLLSPITPALIALSTAFAILGVAMLGIGAGLALAGVGITSLSVALAAGATAIVAGLSTIIIGLLNLVPEIAQIIGRTILETAAILGDYAPQLADSLCKLVVSVVNSLREYAPQLVDSLLVLFIDVINGLSAHIPTLIEAFANLFANIFKGIASAMKDADTGSLLKGIVAIGLMAVIARLLKGTMSILPAAMAGLFAVGVLIAELTLILAAIGGMAQIPGLKWLVTEGGALLEEVGRALGRAIGGIIGGVGEAVSNSLPKIGENIAEMMEFLGDAGQSASSIKPGSFDGVSELIDALGAISLATVGSSISDIFTLGGTSMERFQKDGVAFFNAMSAISESANGIKLDKESIGAIIDFAVGLVDLQKSLEPIGGVMDWFTGRDDLAAFGKNAGTFILSLKTAFGSLDNYNLNAEALKAIVETAIELTELKTSLDGIDGVMDWFVGKKDLASFGINAATFIRAMKNAFNELNGCEFNIKALAQIILGATEMSKLQSTLDSVGGVIDWFTGRDDLRTFGTNARSFIVAMRTAYSELDGCNFNAEALQQIVDGAHVLSTLQSSLDSVGGVIDWFTGRDDLATFGINAGLFILSMKTAYNTLDGCEFNAVALQQIVDGAYILSTLQSSLDSVGGVIDWFTGRDDLRTFGVNAAAFILAMKVAYGSLDGCSFNTEAMNQIVEGTYALSTLQSSLAPVDSIIDWLIGKKDLTTFGVNVAAFILAMKVAYGSLDGCSFNTEAMNQIVEGTYALSTLQSSLAPVDSIIDWFVGKKDLATFGVNCAAFIQSMSIALNSLKDCTFNSEALQAIISATRELSTLQSSLENIGGMIDWFTGRNDLATFGIKINEFISAMKTSLGSLGDFTFNPEALGAIITAATDLSTLQSSLENVGGMIDWFTGRDDLATFGEKIESFINSMKMAFSATDGTEFNLEAMSAVVSAATELSTLQSSLENVGGVISLFSGEKDLTSFGVNIAGFVESIKTAFTGLDDNFTVNVDAVKAIAQSSTDLSTLQSSLGTMGGVIEFFSGEQMDLSTFGTNAAAFIDSMATACGALDGIEVDSTSLSSIISAATELGTLQSTLGSIGGVISFFTGEQMDLQTFGTQIGYFASAMGALRDNMGENGISQSVVDSITNTGNALLALNETLPEKGWFDKKEDLTTFSTHITSFAEALASFSTTASTLNADSINIAMTTANRIKELIDTVSTLDTSGVAKFTGVGTGGMGADGPVADIATAMSTFSSKVSGIDTAAVSTAIASALRLKTLINGLVDLDTSGVPKFKPESIATAMKTYADKVSGMDTKSVSGSVTTANKLKTFINGLSGIDTSGVSSFISAVTDLCSMDIGDFKVPDLSGLGSDLVTSIVSGVTSKSTAMSTSVVKIVTNGLKCITDNAGKFKTGGILLITNLVTGIASKASMVSVPILSAVASAVSAVRIHYNNFNTAGKWLGDGLIQGINSKKQAVYDAGYALGKKAQQGVKDGEGAASPSKEGIKAGKWLGEGLIIGIVDMVRKVYNAGHAMGESAANSLSAALSKANELINSDMDIQPTIRPVLDLSEITAGAGSIGSILGGTSVGVNANVSAISTMMSRRNQNGANADVVNAISKLNDKLNNLGNSTTYNVNGITYDDGSNISAAVKSLVHAAKVERRI